MNQSVTVHLYTTSGCHLCEHAKVMTLPLLEHHGLRLKEIEIADSDQLMTRYGLIIPVLRRVDSGSELHWPFDAEQVEQFLGG